MESLFGLVENIGYVFVGLFVLMVLVTLVFGKRKIKKWEFEADFRDAGNREFGEFDIELSRWDRKEPEFSFKAKFKMRHPSLALHQTVQVFLDDLLVLEGMVEEAGRVYLGPEHVRNEVTEPRVGQQCRVIVGSTELFAEPIVPD